MTRAVECPPNEHRMIVSLDTSEMVGIRPKSVTSEHVRYCHFYLHRDRSSDNVCQCGINVVVSTLDFTFVPYIFV